MEYKMRSSISYLGSSERLHFDRASSSDTSSNEYSYKASTRNKKKCFWKGGDYGNTMNEALVPQNYPKRRIQAKKETETACTLIGKKIRDIRQTLQNKHTTIKLTNVPVKINNILDLYHCFNRFGTITLIQAQRNSNPYCAILSFLTTEEAKNAMENARKIIPDVRAIWFADVCLLTTSKDDCVNVDDTCSSKNINRCTSDDITDLSDKSSCSQFLNAEDSTCDSNFDTKYEENLELLITELIQKKNNLLSHQMNSMREIIEKINKSKIGSYEEKILSQLLKKVQDQIHENRKSIEHSIKQRAEYFAKRRYLSQSKPAIKPSTNFPPWISAFKAATAKQAKVIKQEGKRRKNKRTVRTNTNDGERSSSDSEKTFITISSEASPAELYSNFCRKTIKRPRKLYKDGGYECEMDHLLSDESEIG